MKNIKTHVNENIKAIIVTAILFIMVSLSLWIKEYSNLSEPSLMVLITLSAIFSILIPNLNQLKSFSLVKGELILQEIKDTESSIKELAKALVDVTEASNHNLVLPSFDQEEQTKALEKLKKLSR